MSGIVQIVPKEQITTRVAMSIQVSVEQVSLHEFAQLQVRVFDVNGHVINVHSLRIDGEEYENWSTDDDYIVNVVCSKLGYQPAPVVEPVPEPVVEPVEESQPEIIEEPEPVVEPVQRKMKKNKK